MFNKSSIGLDIADHTIEAIELEKRGGKIIITGGASIKLEPGIVDRGRIKNKQKLKKSIEKVFAKAKPNPIKTKKINFNLPNSAVYYFVFKLDKHEKKERKGLVLKEILKNVPLKVDNLLFSYQKINISKDNQEFLAVVANRNLVDTWYKFFKELGIKLDFFDIEAFLLPRAMMPRETKERVCILDVGARTTNIYFWDNKNLVYSHTIRIGGNKFTSSIASTMKLTKEEAEKKKQKMGLKIKNKKAVNKLKVFFEEIILEINKINKYLSISKEGSLSKMILVGGSSKMPGLKDYFKKETKVEVEIGKPLILNKKTSFRYLGAIGLALRSIDRKWKNDLYIKYSLGESVIQAHLESKKTINKDKKRKIKLLLLLIILFFIILFFIIYKN